MLQQIAKRTQNQPDCHCNVRHVLPVAASGYLPLRFEEDWCANCNKMAPQCWILPRELSLHSVSARACTQGYWPLDFGTGNTMNSYRGDSYTLFRGLVHGDLLVGKHAQIFVQFGTYDETGRRCRPESTDQSNLDLQLFFLAWNGDRFFLRAGRQEVTPRHTSRLIAAREGTNIRLAFDGVRAGWKQEPYRIDAITFRPAPQ